MKLILSIWLYPRKTFKLLGEKDKTDKDFLITMLFFLTSMPAGLYNTYDINKVIGGNYYVGLIIALVFSGLLGLFLWNSVFVYFFWGLGKIFHGKATKDEIRLCLAFSLVPNLIHLAVVIIRIIPATILNQNELINYQHPMVVSVVWILTLRILFFGLAYFNKYKYIYSLLTIIIPVALTRGLLYGLKFLL